MSSQYSVTLKSLSSSSLKEEDFTSSLTQNLSLDRLLGVTKSMNFSWNIQFFQTQRLVRNILIRKFWPNEKYHDIRYTFFKKRAFQLQGVLIAYYSLFWVLVVGESLIHLE
ncbi:PREDICTED: uncharacterized protein LOC106328947 isoform X1 [Brassica oleracea var. oleracea]|uniref:uncharacterized protein LOC106328947 isoform X1 n=1 Tax=Brassica oleracea var. oleracea TaxID=109376 RepID=UPI0006A731DC|nr:PREDICTED: uncharacterized protein LOC106328947 isoform X1 [Brassica oleracea var. oleracea]XP_013622948.1 PREDICTED: uncharacterized protein LOC106328947 isoform X1 [Brassica oleracea var. oleracea]